MKTVGATGPTAEKGSAMDREVCGGCRAPSAGTACSSLVSQRQPRVGFSPPASSKPTEAAWTFQLTRRRQPSGGFCSNFLEPK